MQLPQQRKLSLSEQKEAEKLLRLKANKKLIQDKLASETGKCISLKDLSNMSSMANAGSTRNDLEECVKKLTEKYGELHIHGDWHCTCTCRCYS